MAKKQKKIEISLTAAEVQHVYTSLSTSTQVHEKLLGRPNPALNRVLAKLDKAVALVTAADLEPVKDADADATE